MAIPDTGPYFLFKVLYGVLCFSLFGLLRVFIFS